MPTDPVLDILAHHGVKGMRWGVRRKVGPNGRVVGKTKQRADPSDDYKTVAPLRKKPVHSLSNMELKKLNERIKLEQNFKKMNPTPRERGKQHVEEALKASLGTGLGVAAVVKFMGKAENRAKVNEGIKWLAFKASKESKPQIQLIRQVQKGAFG